MQQPRPADARETMADRTPGPARGSALPSPAQLSPSAPAALADAQRRSGLSDAELARIFHVKAACLTSWRRHGVPRADAHRLCLLSELIDALLECGAPRPLADTLRRPLPQPGEPSLVDLLSRRDTRGITGYLRDLAPGLTLTGRALGAYADS